jgi:hypothetical protein
MQEPDYESYSLEELQQVYNGINREKWPERYKKVKAILNDPVNVEKLKLEAQKESENSMFGPEGSPERKGWGWFYLCIGLILLSTGTFVSKTGSFEIESWPVRIFVFAIIGGVGLMLIDPKLPWKK